MPNAMATYHSMGLLGPEIQVGKHDSKRNIKAYLSHIFGPILDAVLKKQRVNWYCGNRQRDVLHCDREELASCSYARMESH